jgi:hypothetical protein
LHSRCARVLFSYCTSLNTPCHYPGNQRLVLAHRHVITPAGLIYPSLSLSLFLILCHIRQDLRSPKQGALPSFERGAMLADPSVFSPEATSSLLCKAAFARNLLPVFLPAPVLQLLQVRRCSTCTYKPNLKLQYPAFFYCFHRTDCATWQVMATHHRQRLQPGFFSL